MNILNFLIALTLLFCSCSSPLKKEAGINRYDFTKPNKIIITNKLNEISGLTKTSDENIFAIDDELGIIYKLNPSSGKVIKRFFLGEWTVEADFEGIATAGQFIYAISSNGILYKFMEGNNEVAVDYKVIKLPFSSKFEIEGLCYDKELNGLLILPKEYAGKKFKHQRAIYFYSFIDNKIQKEPILLLSLRKLNRNFSIKDFYPSGIAKDPLTGNYFIISARGSNVIVEIDSTGNIINTQKLKESVHRQPEGITILKDGTLLVGDEAAGEKPTITRYILNTI